MLRKFPTYFKPNTGRLEVKQNKNIKSKTRTYVLVNVDKNLIFGLLTAMLLAIIRW
jgi:hypothetical protein